MTGIRIINSATVEADRGGFFKSRKFAILVTGWFGFLAIFGAYRVFSPSDPGDTIRMLVVVGICAFMTHRWGAPLFRVFLDAHRGYVPGQSFYEFRRTDEEIRRYYAGLKVSGFILVLLWMLSRYFFDVKTGAEYLLGIGLASILYGYYGKISKAAHADVDFVAVDILQTAGALTQEKVYAAYQSFDHCNDKKLKAGDAIICVIADGLILYYNENGVWKKARRKFTEFSGIGLSIDKRQEIHLLIRFDDGGHFKLNINFANKLTSEPISFVRHFLQALDMSITGRAPAPATKRKRTATSQQALSAGSAQAQVETFQSQSEMQLRHLELEESTFKEVGGAQLVSGRSLELSL